MKLEEFAKSAGCVVKLMPKDEFEQGRCAYHAKDSPNIMFVGSRQKRQHIKRSSKTALVHRMQQKQLCDY